MTTLSRTDFVSQNASKSIDLAKTRETLSERNQRALATADANRDGKIEGAAELGQAFANLDNFDKNGSRSSINLGTPSAPTALRGTFSAIERATAPRRGLGNNGGNNNANNGGNAGNTNNSGRTTGTTGAAPAAPGNNRGADGTANITRTTNAGARNQMVEGQVTVNGNTYNFRSGGHGRGSLPKGNYEITRHLDSRNDASMSVGGVGFSFAMSDKFDARVGGTRTLLRVHPDGRGPGTEGCLGIVGDAATQRRFRADMQAAIRASGGSYTLRVQ